MAWCTSASRTARSRSLNAKTGAPVWTNQVSDVNEFAGHTGQAGPPTDCDATAGPSGDGLIFAGPNGSSSPLRGHLDAIDATTGALVWRWFTTPDPTQLPFILTWSNPAEAALGGGGTWGSSAIDQGLHEVYSESGNAYAQLGRQPGKDLWTASTYALNENTGQLVWYWQEAHHDDWDLDHGGMPTIENVKINGTTYMALFTCNKDGDCEVVNRTNGRPLPNFPMKETAVEDPSGKGLALNNEYPTQPVSSCLPFTSTSLAHDGTGVAKGAPCATANLLIHCPNANDANESYRDSDCSERHTDGAHLPVRSDLQQPVQRLPDVLVWNELRPDELRPDDEQSVHLREQPVHRTGERLSG